MRDNYKNWLIEQEYSTSTQTAQLHRIGRIENYYGSLDDIIGEGRLDQLLQDLTYSANDSRINRENPSRIPVEGDIRNNLQSYKNAVVRYNKFAQSLHSSDDGKLILKDIPAVIEHFDDEKQRLSLERDMQKALRLNVGQLEEGLRIVDDGAERSVSSGFIDILCEDRSGKTVVVELKAGKTDTRVVGQILGYMGDLIIEDERVNIRGIIVAHEFDKRTIAASKAVSNLSLVRYSISFRFEALE